MGDFIAILSEYLARNRSRAKNFYLLKASMAAAALVAKADGVACSKESRRAKDVIRFLKLLQLFDSRHGLEIFAQHVRQLEKSPERGRAEVMKAIRAVAGNPEEAALMVQICRSISEADGKVTEDELEALDHICLILDIDPTVVEKVKIEAPKPYED